jgi:hypothetical protein
MVCLVVFVISDNQLLRIIPKVDDSIVARILRQPLRRIDKVDGYTAFHFEKIATPIVKLYEG